MRWVPVTELSHEQMVKVAADRGTVRLRSGQIAGLVMWPLYQRPDAKPRRGWHCRLETTSGSRFSLHVDEVEAVAAP